MQNIDPNIHITIQDSPQSVDFRLLENNDYRLLENGNLRRLESGN